jgi:hypothetical protein
VEWYIASFVTHRQPARSGSALCQSREYWCLLAADGSELAHAKALSLARAGVDDLNLSSVSDWVLDGLSDLLMLSEPPTAGSELIWTEQEVLPQESNSFVSEKSELSAFSRPEALCSSGWYVCKVVLVEIHDTGRHGDSLLLWTNSHLIEAADPEVAYKSAISLGREQESEPGSHRCDGDSAHWAFKGLGDLVPTIDVPRDGPMLWFNEFDASLDQLITLIPSRSKLGVFDSLERQKGAGVVV